MRYASRPGLGGTLGLLVVLSACGGENLFPVYPITGTGPVVTGAIEGSVTAGAPLGNVSVILIGRDSTVTDDLGRFRFAGLPSSTYSVAVRVPLNHALAPGDSATRQVRLRAGASERVTWNLISPVPIP